MMRTLTFALFCLLLASCNFPVASAAVPVKTSIMQIQPVTPTKTFVAQFTDTPLPTPRPTATLRPTPVATEVTPQLDVATETTSPRSIFEHARIYGLAHLQNGHFLITVEVPGRLAADYQATLGGEPFRCQILPEYPNRLYCNGPTSFTGLMALFQIQETGSPAVVYETEIGIPPSPYDAKEVDAARRNRRRGDSGQTAPTPTSEPYPSP